jgi:Fe2+ or Zn2+ uptake regulation protein
MIIFILSFLIGWLLFSLILSAHNVGKSEPFASKCPPHQWSYKKVYNEDGTVHHEHLVCAKCGPLKGEADDQ